MVPSSTRSSCSQGSSRDPRTVTRPGSGRAGHWMWSATRASSFAIAITQPWPPGESAGPRYVSSPFWCARRGLRVRQRSTSPCGRLVGCPPARRQRVAVGVGHCLGVHETGRRVDLAVLVNEEQPPSLTSCDTGIDADAGVARHQRVGTEGGSAVASWLPLMFGLAMVCAQNDMSQCSLSQSDGGLEPLPVTIRDGDEMSEMGAAQIWAALSGRSATCSGLVSTMSRSSTARWRDDSSGRNGGSRLSQVPERRASTGSRRAARREG